MNFASVKGTIKTQIVIGFNVLAFNLLSNELKAQSIPIKEICNDAIDVQDSTIFIRNLSKCNNFKCDNLQSTSFVIDLINDVIGASTISIIPNIYPGPPIASDNLIDSLHIVNPINGRRAEKITFYPETGYTSNSRTKYTLPDRLEYDFKCFAVPKEKREITLRNLGKLNNFGMYQKFKKYIDKEVPFSVPSDEFASYCQSYNLEDSIILKGLSLDKNLFPKGQLKKLWVECYLPVDNNWMPVGIPSRNVRPIAIEIDKNLYLFAQSISYNFENGGSADYYEGKVFDLSKAGDYKSVRSNLLPVFIEEINKQFTTSPLECSQIVKGLAPLQVRFQRQYEKSVVLEGFTGPYYETSTYTILLWFGPSNGFLGSGIEYQTYDYLNETYRNDQIYLQINHSLQISVSKPGKYVEPQPYQYSAYQKAVSKAINKAIVSTTKRLNGSVLNNIGIIH